MLPVVGVAGGVVSLKYSSWHMVDPELDGEMNKSFMSSLVVMRLGLFGGKIAWFFK